MTTAPATDQQPDSSQNHDECGASKSITITVLFFASARDAVDGIREIQLPVPIGCTTQGFRQILADRYPALGGGAEAGLAGGSTINILDDSSITLALNEEFVASGEVIALKQGDTVALIPPISGG